MPNERTKRRAARLLGVVLAAVSGNAALAQGVPHVDGKWHARFDAHLQGVHAVLLKNGDVLLVLATKTGPKTRRNWATGNPDTVILAMDYNRHPDEGLAYAEPKFWAALQMNEIEPNDPDDNATYSCPNNGSFEEMEYNFFCAGHAQLADGRLLFVGGPSDPYNPAIDGNGTPACCDEENKGPKVDSHNLTALFDPDAAQDPNNPWDASSDDMWVDPADPVDPVDRWYPTLTRLGRGKIFVTAGRTDDCRSTLADYPAVFDPTALGAQWTHYTDIPGARMPLPPETPQPTYPFMFLRTTGELFFAGQFVSAYKRTQVFHENGDKQWADLPDWNDQTKNAKLYCGSAATYFRLASGNHQQFVLKAGGNPDNPAKFGRAAERIELTAADPKWEQTTNLMTDPLGRANLQLLTLPTGRLLAMGGHENNDQSKLDDIVVNPSIYTQDLYDPDTDLWTILDAKAWEPEGPNPPEDQKRRYSRRIHSGALLLPDGRVLISGGQYRHLRTEECPTNQCVQDPEGWDETLCFVDKNTNEWWCWYRQQTAQVYSPKYLFNSDDTERQAPNQRPEIASAPSVLRYGEAFTITYNGTHTFNPDWAVCLIRLGAATHGFDHETRYVPLASSSSVPGLLTVSMPTSWNILPKGYYMLFINSLDNGIRVPSKARIVRVDDPL